MTHGLWPAEMVPATTELGQGVLAAADSQVRTRFLILSDTLGVEPAAGVVEAVKGSGVRCLDYGHVWP